MKPAEKHEAQLEQRSLSGYDRLAQNLYNRSVHPTTYAFGVAIEEYLNKHWTSPTVDCPFLEVGAGKSRLFGRLKAPHRFIVSDLSLSMLSHSRRCVTNDYPAFLVASAFRLPFQSGRLGGVFSILGDAYGTPAFFKEAFRVLVRDGALLYIAPSAVWGHTLRRSLGIEVDVTTLRSDDGDVVVVPSILFPNETLGEHVADAGFSRVHVSDLFCPNKIELADVPPHIAIAARELGLDPHSIPITTVVTAVKETDRQ